MGGLPKSQLNGNAKRATSDFNGGCLTGITGEVGFGNVVKLGYYYSPYVAPPNSGGGGGGSSSSSGSSNN